jgi:uncharacterized protein (UPF0335 family)
MMEVEMESGQVNGTAVLQAKLNEPNVVGALTRLLDRIDSLEQTVEKLTTAVEQAPGMMAMAADAVDDVYAQAAAKGVDVDARLRTALAMAERLTAPEMLARLDGLLMMAEQAPGLSAMAADAVDDVYRQAAERGVDIDARLRAGLEIAEKLTAPEMIANLNQVLAMAEQGPGLAAMIADMVDDAFRRAGEKGIDIDGRLRAGLEITEKLTSPEMLANLDGLVTMANQGPGLMAMTVDIVDDTYAQAVQHGIDPENLGRQAIMVTTRLAELLESGEINNLLDSGVLDPEAVGVVSSAANALVESRNQTIEPVGLIGMMKALRDPDLQNAIGFLMSFGKQFGKNL